MWGSIYLQESAVLKKTSFASFWPYKTIWNGIESRLKRLKSRVATVADLSPNLVIFHSNGDFLQKWLVFHVWLVLLSYRGEIIDDLHIFCLFFFITKEWRCFGKNIIHFLQIIFWNLRCFLAENLVLNLLLKQSKYICCFTLSLFFEKLKVYFLVHFAAWIDKLKFFIFSMHKIPF